MRLTMILMHVRRKRPPGFLYRGKNRLVRPLTSENLHHVRINFERVEQNMLILRHPYLTSEQSSGHSKALKALNPPLTMVEKNNIERNRLFQKHFEWNDQLCHLLVTEAWEY